MGTDVDSCPHHGVLLFLLRRRWSQASRALKSVSLALWGYRRRLCRRYRGRLGREGHEATSVTGSYSDAHSQPRLPSAPDDTRRGGVRPRARRAPAREDSRRDGERADCARAARPTGRFSEQYPSLLTRHLLAPMARPDAIPTISRIARCLLLRPRCRTPGRQRPDTSHPRPA